MGYLPRHICLSNLSYSLLVNPYSNIIARRKQFLVYTWICLCLVLVSTDCLAQKGAAGVPLTTDPILSIQATGGYFFWNAREVYDTMSSVVHEHNSALNKGFRYGGDIMLHFGDGFSFGPTYRQLGTAHTTDPNHWSIPVTDSNNRVVIDPNTGGLLYGPRYGSISERIDTWFVGLRLTKEFELKNNFYAGLSFAPGIINYVEVGNYVGYKVRTEGSDLAVDISLDGRYQFDRNWAAVVQLSLFNGAISNPDYTDLQQGVVDYNLTEPQSLLNYSINAAIRFTFNKKKGKPKQSTTPQGSPVPPKKKKRFNL